MLEVQTVDTNDFTKNFRRRKSDEMSQGVLWTQLMLQAVQLTFSWKYTKAELQKYMKLLTIEQNKRQMNNRLWFSDSHFYFSTYEDLKLCFHIKSVG